LALQTDLSEFVALLISRKVEFVVVGGHAVAFHGHPRYTGDIDIFIRPSPENAAKVMDALVAFGFGGLSISMEDLSKPARTIQLGRPPNRIDLLTIISGVSFEEAWETRVRGDLGGQGVDYIGFDALILNKQASGRDRDQMDVKQLQRIRR
jgi:predicted nucleotidyltransferase